MDTLPGLLREAMVEETKDLALRADVAGRAWAAARRTHRWRTLVGAGSALATVGVLTLTLALTRPPDVRPPTPSTGSAAASTAFPGSRPSSGSSLSPTAGSRWSVKGAPSGSVPSPALLVVSLSDPAPGFPLRRAPDTTAYTTFAPGLGSWARIFLVDRSPQAIAIGPNGAVTRAPTGPEATVMVAQGAMATRPNANGRLGGLPVSGTRMVAGHVAYLTRERDVLTLTFAAGSFAVRIAGCCGSTIDDLVTLGTAIHGLPK